MQNSLACCFQKPYTKYTEIFEKFCPKLSAKGEQIHCNQKSKNGERYCCVQQPY